MFAIPNKIVIGDVESPILTFENDAIKEVLEETGISAVGEELYIDQFMPTVRYAFMSDTRYSLKTIMFMTGFCLLTGKLYAANGIMTFVMSPMERRRGFSMTGARRGRFTVNR